MVVRLLRGGGPFRTRSAPVPRRFRALAPRRHGQAGRMVARARRGRPHRGAGSRRPGRITCVTAERAEAHIAYKPFLFPGAFGFLPAHHLLLFFLPHLPDTTTTSSSPIMAPVPPGSLVLVTSGSGFVGAWVVLYALRAGYKVRTTVRSEAKGQYLKQLFASYGDAFSYVLVPDLRAKGGFDSAVAGVRGVIHTGSPVDGDPNQHPDDSFIAPAVEGATNVLEALLAQKAHVDRVVLTSSTAAIAASGADANATFTPDDWNTPALNLYQADPTGEGKGFAYPASKVLAERAAWDFIETKRTPFDLTTICPTFIFGPLIQQLSGPSPEKLNFSLRIQWELFNGQVPVEDYQLPKGGYVDVRDVADLHVKALSVPEAGGQRYVSRSSTPSSAPLSVFSLPHGPFASHLLLPFPLFLP